jgi:hypothetical protein
MLSRKTAESRLIVPGRIVGSADGRVFLVLSSVATKDGLSFRLADLDGRPVDATGFDPVPPQFVRLASMLRLGFDRKIDEFVKAWIRAAGFPVDPTMHWDKYIYTSLKPTAGTFNEDTIDEAIREIVIRVMGSREILDPSKFQHVAENFAKTLAKDGVSLKYPGFLQLPLAKQVTYILKSNFNSRRGEMRRIVRYLEDRGKPSDELSEENFLTVTPDDGLSPIETPEYATGTKDFEQAEEAVEMGDYTGRSKNVTIGRFANGFREWLLKRERLPVVRQTMRLLSILHEGTQAHGRMPKLDDIERRWTYLQNRDDSSKNRLAVDKPRMVTERGQVLDDVQRALVKRYRDEAARNGLSAKELGIVNGLGRVIELPSMKELLLGLPTVMEIYVRTHFHGQESVLPLLVRTLVKIGEEKRQRKLEESGRDRAERAKVKEEDEEAPSVPPSEPKTSAQKGQWVPPKCLGCGGGGDLKACPECKGNFCMLCMRDHHANNPGHDGVGR